MLSSPYAPESWDYPGSFLLSLLLLRVSLGLCAPTLCHGPLCARHSASMRPGRNPLELSKLDCVRARTAGGKEVNILRSCDHIGSPMKFVDCVLWRGLARSENDFRVYSDVTQDRFCRDRSIEFVVEICGRDPSHTTLMGFSVGRRIVGLSSQIMSKILIVPNSQQLAKQPILL